MAAEEVAERRRLGRDPRETIAASPELAQALSSIRTGAFSPGEPDRFADLIDGLYDHDWFMLTDDFDDYCRAQREVDALWSDRSAWNTKAVLNTARVGWFSSDRTIRQYASEIWDVFSE
jgi:starch phosphorylase